MIIIYILFILFSLYDYKKAVFFTASTLMFMNNLSSGIPGVKLFYAVAIVQIILFYLLGYNKKNTKDSFPLFLLVPILCAVVTYFVSNYVGIIHSYAKTFVNVLTWFYFPYIVWQLLSTKEDVVYMWKSLICFFFVVGVYAVIELLVGHNIYSEWADKAGIIQGELGGLNTVERFGILRCNSILPWNSALGMTSSLMFLVLILLRSKRITVLPLLENALVVLLPLSVLLCGGRSLFLALAICVVGLMFSSKIRKNKTYKGFVVLAIIALIFFAAYFEELVRTILHSDDSSAGGSSMTMRLNQFAIVEYYWQQSPWFGNGRNFTWEYVIPYNAGLLGAESIIFVQLLDHGLFGLVTYYAIGICLTVWCYHYSISLAALPIAFLFAKTVSTIVGVEYCIPLVFSIIAIKGLSLSMNKRRIVCVK